MAKETDEPYHPIDFGAFRSLLHERPSEGLWQRVIDQLDAAMKHEPERFRDQLFPYARGILARWPNTIRSANVKRTNQLLARDATPLIGLYSWGLRVHSVGMLRRVIDKFPDTPIAHLDLSGGKHPASDLEWLASIDALGRCRSVKLDMFGFEDARIGALWKNSSGRLLETLSFNHVNMEPEDFAELARSPMIEQVRTLRLRGGYNVDPVALDDFLNTANFASLEHLTIMGGRDQQMVDFLDNFSQHSLPRRLRGLRLGGYLQQEEDLKAYTRFFESLAGGQLEELGTSWSNLSGAPLRALLESAKTLNLSVLDLRACSLTDEDAEALASCEALEGLRLLGIADSQFTEAGYELVGRSRYLQLTRIDANSRAWNKRIKMMQKPENHSCVDLRGEKVNDAMLEKLAHSPEWQCIRRLEMSNTTVTDRFADLLVDGHVPPNLRHLRVSGSMITAVGWYNLRRSGALDHVILECEDPAYNCIQSWVGGDSVSTHLALRGPVTVDVVTWLVQQPEFEVLESLDLYGCRADNEVAMALAALPAYGSLDSIRLDSNRLGLIGAHAIAGAEHLRGVIDIDNRSSSPLGFLVGGASNLSIGRENWSSEASELFATLPETRQLTQISYYRAVYGEGQVEHDEEVREMFTRADLSNVEELRMSSWGMDPELVFDFLDPEVFPNLRSLRMWTNDLSRESVQRLIESPRVRELELVLVRVNVDDVDLLDGAPPSIVNGNTTYR